MSLSPVSSVRSQVGSPAGEFPLEYWFFHSELQVLSLLQECGDPVSDPLLTSAQDFLRKYLNGTASLRDLSQQLLLLHGARHKAVQSYSQRLQETEFQQAGSLLQRLNQMLEEICQAIYQTRRAPLDWHTKIAEAICQCREAYLHTLQKMSSKKAHYTESDSRIRNQQGDSLTSNQAQPAPQQPNLNESGDAGRFEIGAMPTQPEPIIESRAVYILANRKMQILTCYTDWETILKNQAWSFQNRWDTLLKIRQILFVDKEVWLQQSLQPHPPCTLALLKLDETALASALNQLSLKIDTCKARIAQRENTLLQRLDILSRASLIGTRILLTTWYVQKADTLITSQECAMQKTVWKNSPPLTRAQLNLSIGVTAVGLFLMDITQWKASGLSVNLPSALAPFITPDVEMTARVFKLVRLGDEKTAALSMNTLRHLVQWSLILWWDSYWNSRSIGETVVAYSVVICVGKCAAKGIDLFYQGKKHPTYLLAHTLGQLIFFTLAARYLAPYVLVQWNILFWTPNEASEKSKQAACALLGLEGTASPSEVELAYRYRARQFHPDQPFGYRTRFQQLLEARDLCGSKSKY